MEQKLKQQQLQMQTKYLLVACVLLFVGTTLASFEEDTIKFKEFARQYNKRYGPNDFHIRYKNFLANMDRIRELNAKYPTAHFEVNQFADMSPEEFQDMKMLPNTQSDDLAQSCLANGVLASFPPTDIPTSFDWREKNAVTPVKDQGACGSCWTFSVTGAIESANAVAGKGLVGLSEQQLVDCSHACCTVSNQQVCNSGCGGGWMWNAMFDVINWGGLESETSYPYTGGDGACQMTNTSKFAGSMKNYTCLSNPDAADEEKMAEVLIQKGPLSIAMNADLLMSYSSGIIQPGNSCSGTYLNHALLIVGFGEDNGTKYWIVKNSWGESWGEEGYFRIQRGVGACGINNAVVSVLV